MDARARKRRTPGWVIILLAVVGLLALVLADETIRENQGKLLLASPLGHALSLRIEGKVKPDWLWSGEAWRLELTLDGSSPLSAFLEVDGVALDPPFLLSLSPGIPEFLYCNHDHSNVRHGVPSRLGLRTDTGTFEWSIERAP